MSEVGFGFEFAGRCYMGELDTEITKLIMDDDNYLAHRSKEHVVCILTVRLFSQMAMIDVPVVQ